MQKIIKPIWAKQTIQETIDTLYVHYELKYENVSITFSVRAPTVCWNYWLPTDLTYHSDKPVHSEHIKVKHCAFRPNGCYCDGSATAGTKLFEAFRDSNFNEEVIWKRLEEFYNERASYFNR